MPDVPFAECQRCGKPALSEGVFYPMRRTSEMQPEQVGTAANICADCYGDFCDLAAKFMHMKHWDRVLAARPA